MVWATTTTWTCILKRTCIDWAILDPRIFLHQIITISWKISTSWEQKERRNNKKTPGLSKISKFQTYNDTPWKMVVAYWDYLLFFGARPVFRGEVLVAGRISPYNSERVLKTQDVTSDSKKQPNWKNMLVKMGSCSSSPKIFGLNNKQITLELPPTKSCLFII